MFFSFCACSSLFCLARVRSSFVHKRASEIALDWIRSDRSLAEYGDCSLLVGRFVDNVDWECRVRGFKPLDDRAKARCLLPVFVVVSLFGWCAGASAELFSRGADSRDPPPSVGRLAHAECFELFRV